MPASASDHSWHCIMDGIAYGPVPFQQLREWATSGHLQKHHRVWRQGDTERQIASRVDGLFDAGSRTSQPAAPAAKPRESSTQHKPVVLEPRRPKEQPAPKPAPIPKAVAAPVSAGVTARPATVAEPVPAPPVQPVGHPAATHDVFISYSSKDKPIGDAICASLEQAKIRCWIAPRDVVHGMSYGESIIDGISVSKVMVVVLSKASNVSPHVLREVERAVSKGIQIIPFRVEDVKPTKSLEYFLSTPHWLDAFTPPMESHVEQLKQVVQSALNPKPTSTSDDDTARTPGRPYGQGVTVQRLAKSPWPYLSIFSLMVIVLLSRLLLRGKDTTSTTPNSVASAPAIVAEFEKYKQGLISGRGSIVFLKEAATERYAHWMDAAKAGDPIAQLFVARCLQEGLVVKQDEKAAIEWLNKSAAAGNEYAMHTLGLAYNDGKGIGVNLSEALRWYQAAADKGNSVSLRNMASMYIDGVDNKGSQPAMAVSLLRKAADMGDPVAMRRLANAYQNGTGIARDVAEAERWMAKSTQAGDPYTLGTALSQKLSAEVKHYLTVREQAVNQSRTDEQKRLQQLLDAPTNRFEKLAEQEFTFSEYVDLIKTMFGITLVIDTKSFRTGVPSVKNADILDIKVTLARMPNVPLKTILKQILDDLVLQGKSLDATYVLRDNYLEITTTASLKAEERGRQQQLTASGAHTNTLAAIQRLKIEVLALDLTGMEAFFDSKWRTVQEEVKQLHDQDPVYLVYLELVQHYIDRFKNGTLSERQMRSRDLAQNLEHLLERWYKQSRYDETVTLWTSCMKDIPFAYFKNSYESDSLVRFANYSTRSMLHAGQRKEAMELLAQTLDLCDWVLKERPWDWYTKDAYMGMCFMVAEVLTEVGETSEVQALLKRAWTVSGKMTGNEAIIARYEKLPLKGKVPPGASPEDAAFFERYSSNPAKKSKGGGMKRFTIPCDFSGEKYPFHVYVLSGPRAYLELQDQFRWLKEMRGGTVPIEVRDSFRRLNAIAVENNVSFMDLCVYALGTAAAEGEKKKEESKK